MPAENLPIAVEAARILAIWILRVAERLSTLLLKVGNQLMMLCSINTYVKALMIKTKTSGLMASFIMSLKSSRNGFESGVFTDDSSSDALNKRIKAMVLIPART